MEVEPYSKYRLKIESNIQSNLLPAKGKASTEQILLAIFIFLVANIVAFGYISYRNYEKNFLKDATSQLAAISDLKAGEIGEYVKERMADGGMLFRRNALYNAVRRFLEDPGDSKNTEYLREWLARYATHYQYDNVTIIDAQGVVRLGIPNTGEKFCCPATLKRMNEIMRKGEVALDDFCRNEDDRRVYLGVAIPILDEDKNSPALGVLILRIDPEIYLYPFIDKWPIPSETAETLLVRRDGNDVLFLNELRFRKNSALNLRFPIASNKDLPAVKAALGKTGIVEGRDYRGVRVIAYVRAVTDTPWFMVARIDVSEAYKPMRRQLWSIIWLVITTVIAVGAVIWFIWRRQNMVFYRAQYLASKAVRASEERYRRLFEAAKDGVLLVDFDTGIIADVNPFLIDLLGYPKPELLKKYLWDIGAFKNIVASKDEFAELKIKGYVRYEDQPLEAKDGKIVDVEFVSNVYEVDSTKTVQCNIRDITEHRRLEKELAQAKEMQYRTLIESLPQKVFLKDKNSVYISCNGNYAKDLKIESEEISGKTDHDFFPTYLAEKYREDDKRVMESGQTENFEEEFVVIKDFLRGAQRAIINTVKVPVRDKSGNVTGVFGLFWDITDRKKSEEAVRDLNQQIEFILGATHTGLDIIDSDFNVVYIDPEWQKVYGPPAGRKCYEYFMDRNEECPDCGVRKAFETKKPVITEEILKKEGDRHIQVTSMPFPDRDGNWLVAEVNVDITERKKAEEIRSRLYELINKTPNFIGFADAKTQNVSYINPAGRRMIGIEEDRDLSNFKISDVHPEWTNKLFRDEIIPVAIRDGSWTGECAFLHRDGHEIYVDMVLVAHKTPSGEIKQFSTISRDITERKKVEDDVRKAESLKVSADIKSKFTSMVSHELRSPMAVIKESINLVLEELVGGLTSEQRDILDTAKSNVDRLGRLINNVLDFQKIELGKMALDIKECDLNEIVMITSKEMSLLAEEKKLIFTVNIDESIPVIKLDKDKIVQVITNLLSNAIKFTEKGHITVTTEREDNTLHVMVEDTGPGIQAEEMPKLFQTFEQLGGGLGKKRGGTGLGLAISKEIIQAHNGKIWAESQFGKGSTFHFTLPIKERRG